VSEQEAMKWETSMPFPETCADNQGRSHHRELENSSIKNAHRSFGAESLELAGYAFSP
jgi:hypothetical protein